MAESIKTQLLVDERGQIKDDGLAEKMAYTEKEIRDALGKKEDADDDKKELEKIANQTSEGVFRQEAGKEYSDALKEAQIEASYEEKAGQEIMKTKKEINEDIKNGERTVENNPGAFSEDRLEAKNAGSEAQEKIDEAAQIAREQIEYIGKNYTNWEKIDGKASVNTENIISEQLKDKPGAKRERVDGRGIIEHRAKKDKEILDRIEKGVKDLRINNDFERGDEKNPDFRPIEDRVASELEAVKDSLDIFKNGQSEKLDGLVGDLIKNGEAKGDPKSEKTRNYLKIKLEDQQRILYRIKALVGQSKSPEEFQSKIAAELEFIKKQKNNEIAEAKKNKNEQKIRNISNKYSAREDVLNTYLPAKKESKPEPIEKNNAPVQDKKEPKSAPDKSTTEREQIVSAYDQRIANLRLGVEEAKAAGKEDEVLRLGKFLKEVESEKSWRLREYDDKSNKGKSKKSPDAPADGKTIEPKNKDRKEELFERQEWHDNMLIENMLHSLYQAAARENKTTIWSPYLMEYLSSGDLFQSYYRDLENLEKKYNITIPDKAGYMSRLLSEVEKRAPGFYEKINNEKNKTKASGGEKAKNPTELENDIEETGHRTHGPVYANESIPEGALEDKEKQKAKKSAEKMKEAKEEAKETREKTPEEILREKNIEAYGGAENLNQIFEDYKRLNELEDQKAYYDNHPLFPEWDALRVKLANINLEIIGKNRTVDLYKIQNRDGQIREYFDTKLEELFDDFKKSVKKESETAWALRAATLIKYRNELKNCEWQGKDFYRDVPKEKYIEIIKELEQKIDILEGLLDKKEGVSPKEALKDLEIDDFKKIEKEPVVFSGDKAKEAEEQKLEQEAAGIEDELKNTPPKERRKIGLGIRTFGFFLQEKKSKGLAKMCEWLSGAANKISGQELDEKGKVKSIETAGSMTRFLASLAETYRRDEKRARQGIDQDPATLKQGAWRQMQNAGYLSGNILKYGRTVADVAGWTAGSPLRYFMMGSQLFARGAEAAKEARLKNAEVIDKTRLDHDEAVEEAYKIYEQAKESATQQNSGKVTAEAIERAYLDQLPQDILNRLRKSEPGAASGIVERIGQKALQKYVELSIKAGKFTKIGLQKRLKEYDAMVSKYGTVDALAMSAKLAETAGKTAIAAVSVETAYLALKNLPSIIEKIENAGSGTKGSGHGIFSSWKETPEGGRGGGSGKSAYDSFMGNKPKNPDMFPGGKEFWHQPPGGANKEYPDLSNWKGGGAAPDAASGVSAMEAAGAGARPETAQFVDEIKNIGGIKHDSIWRSTYDLVHSHAKEMNMEYPGKGGTKLSETEWYNLKTSQLVNELGNKTPGGIKDLVHEADKVVAAKSADGTWRIALEESSGIKAGRLADLHPTHEGKIGEVIKNYEAGKTVEAPVEPLPQSSRVAPEPWDSHLKQEFKVIPQEGQAEAAAQHAVDKQLNEIFKYPFGRQGAETITYQNVKNDSAEAFLHRDFFKEMAGNHDLDVSEKDALMHDIPKFENLQKHLNNLIHQTGNRPRAGETIDQYIHRVNHDISATPTDAVPENIPTKESVVAAAAEKKASVAESVLKNPEKVMGKDWTRVTKVFNENFSSEIKFVHNQSGEPIGIEGIESYVPGVRGSEYFKADYLKTVAEGYKNSYTLEQAARTDIQDAGKRLVGSIEAYKELDFVGPKQKAAVLLDYIKEQITNLNKKFGKEIINRDALPEILRK